MADEIRLRFSFELMATVVAIKIAVALDAYNCRIHTDCQSVQKLLTPRNLLRSLSKKENLVLLQLGMVDTEHIDKNWIPGHPERTVPDRNLWTKHMWGNHMADATAAEDLKEEEWDVQCEHTAVSVRDALQAMAKEPSGCGWTIWGHPSRPPYRRTSERRCLKNI